MPAKGNGSSTTKSAISPGTITIRENPNQNIDGMSRYTTNSLNKLGKIFDKKTVEERQKLAGIFGKEANEAIHRISKQLGWKDGSAQKMALHVAVAGITAQMTGNSFASGAVAGGVNEAAIKKIMNKVGKDHPDVAQAVSTVLGYAANTAIGQDGNTGATVAWHGTKWNAYGARPWFNGSFIQNADGSVYLRQDDNDQYYGDTVPHGAYIWIQDPDNPSMGWDYQKGTADDGSDEYLDNVVTHVYYTTYGDNAYGIIIYEYPDYYKVARIRELGKEYVEAALLASATERNLNLILDGVKLIEEPNSENEKEFLYEVMKKR
jgi:hypothetical protein